MEEQKLPDCQVPLWQWQSDKYPYKIKDETKWTWQDYPQESHLILEKAFQSNQEIADLGDYEVDLKKMLQIKKTDKNKVRRVRRQGNGLIQSRLLNEIPEPVVISSDQKTMSLAFGTIQHFLEYMMKRTPESHKLYQSLMKLSLDSKEAEFKEIIEEVVRCIQKGAEAREKIIKTRSNRWNQNHISEAEKIASELKDKSETLRDFLKTILRIYTKETFVCYWLNELLRNDNWTEINVLTPYLVCLTYTFKLSEYTLKYEGGILNATIGYWNSWKLYLYRGSAMTAEQLAQYDITKVRYFSWNCVTSTSRLLDIALGFTRQSLINAENEKISKVGIVFMIEADFGSIEDCQGMIDVSGNSRYPEEKEVILAPGTVFELVKIQLNKKTNFYEIQLKVRRKFEEVKEDIPLLGALQEQAIFADKAIIEGMPSINSFRILELLEGNKLIKGLEIRNSHIEEHTMELIENTRVSTNLKKENIRLSSNEISISSLGVLAYYFTPGALNDVLLANNIVYKNGKIDWKMKKIVLRERVLQKYMNNSDQFKHFLEALEKEDQITEMSLLMKDLRVSDQGLTLTWESLKFLVSLEDFNLTLNSTTFNANQLFSALGRTLESLKHLKSISLYLRECASICNDTLKIRLAPPALQQLDLDFGFCQNISDTGLRNLSQALESLTSLKNLSLNFEGCIQISDQGLSGLKDMIMSSKALRHISLDFGNCKEISDIGLRYLGDALRDLQDLQDLSLEFWHCRKISDRGLLDLSQGIKSLTSLSGLSLAFGGCRKFSYDEGLKHIERALPSLGSLRKMTLDVPDCPQISNSEIANFDKAVATHSNRPCLALNKRSCEDISPLKKWDLESLKDNPSLCRAIFWGILILFLCAIIFGRYLIYLFMILACVDPVKKFYKEKPIRNGPQSFFAILIGILLNYWGFNLLETFLSIVIGFLARDLSSSTLYLMPQVFYALGCLTMTGCFMLGCLIENFLAQKLYRIVFYSKNQDLWKEARELLHNPYINPHDSFKTMLQYYWLYSR